MPDRSARNSLAQAMASIGAVAVRGQPADAALGRRIAEGVAAGLAEMSWSGDRAIGTLRLTLPADPSASDIRAALARSLGGHDG